MNAGARIRIYFERARFLESRPSLNSDTTEERFLAQTREHLARIRAEFGEAVAAMEEMALRANWQMEESLRILDPLLGEATRNARHGNRPMETQLNLRSILHRFGQETNQGEVVVEFDGRFDRIKTYDKPTG